MQRRNWRQLLLLILLVATGAIAAVGTVAVPTERRLSEASPDTILDAQPTVVVTGGIARLQPAYVRNGRIYAVEERSVYVSDNEGSTFRLIGHLPRQSPEEFALSTWLKDKLSRREIVRRLRGTPGSPSLVVLESGTIVVVSDRIYRMGSGEPDFEIVPEAVEDRLAPYQSGGAMAVGQGDTIYYGEYTTAQGRRPIRIIRATDDGREWTVAHTFEAGSIYHVHSIAWDRYRGKYWVTTGDSDSESALFHTSDGFRTLERLGGGSQDWRIVAPLVRPGALVWGSDDGRSASSIFRWDFEADSLVEVGRIGNPASYVATLADGTMLVSTMHVPQTVYGRSGAGTVGTSLWASRDGRKWVRILTLAGAERQSGLRPQIRLPGGDDSSAFAFIAPFFTTQHDFSLLKLEIRWD